MKKNLLPVKSFAFFSLQTTKDKIFHVLTDFYSWRKYDLPSHYFLFKTFLSLLNKHPRYFSYQHLICHNPQRPNVTFMSVSFLIQNLRSHIARSPYKSFKKTLIIRVFSKTKICNFKNFIFDQDIFRFKVSMGNSIFDKLSKTTENLEQRFHCSFFCESPCLEKVRSQSSTLCQFEDNVEIIDCFMNIKKSDNVRTLEFLIDLNLRVEGVFVVLILENFVLVDNFDGHLGLSFLLNSKVDFRKGSFSQFGSKEDNVFAYSFFGVTHQLNENIITSKIVSTVKQKSMLK